MWCQVLLYSDGVKIKILTFRVLFRFVLLCSGLVHMSLQQAYVGRESFVTRNVRNIGDGDEKDINWADVDDLPPEWDRVESGIDDLLSLSTTYWEPGLGPRAPRRVPGMIFKCLYFCHMHHFCAHYIKF